MELNMGKQNTLTKYEVKIDGKSYNFDHSNITGAELLSKAGKTPPNDYVIYTELEDGDLETIRPNENVSVDRLGIEQFHTFKTDVIYRIEVNGESREWGARFITGKAIKKLSGIGTSNEFGIWQATGHDERFIRDNDKVDLSNAGIERFRLGGKFSICIEGKSYEWSKDTITASEIAQLGGWGNNEGVVEIEPDQTERTLSPDEIIHLKHGQKFCKHVRFKRGLNDPRMTDELKLLQDNLGAVGFIERDDGYWFELPKYQLPAPLSPSSIKVSFFITKGHPTAAPYGFYVSQEIKHGQTIIPLNDPPNCPPFDGTWKFVSWAPENWIPSNSVHNGHNLWSWARSFRVRLMEGV